MSTPLHEQKHLGRDEALRRLSETPGWTLAEDAASVSREFAFNDFGEALAFINAVGDLAERENHHPDIHCRWNTVRLDLSTHAVGGLSADDFILAAKINRLQG